MSPLLLFFFLQILDGMTTYIGLTNHEMMELNPVPGSVMSFLGTGLGITLFKIFACGLGYTLCRYFNRTIPALVNYCGAGVVFWNLLMIILYPKGAL